MNLLHRIRNRPFNRKKRILSRITAAKQKGLEIGPLDNPMVTKTESSGRIQYIDHLPADKLHQLYLHDTLVVNEKIVDLDYVWDERPLVDVVNGKRFDYVIASHVIEHIPDMLGWLKEIAEVLEDGGILSLAIPDKRYSFDYFRELSTPGMLVDAYLRRARRPSPQAIFDHVAQISAVDVRKAWKKSIDRNNLKLTNSPETALELAKHVFLTETYHDVHVNVFTPSSFLYLLEIFSRVQLLDYILVDFHDTARNTVEFFASLKRCPRQLNDPEKLPLQLAAIDSAKKSLH